MATLDQKKNFALATTTNALGIGDTSWILTAGQGVNLPDTADGAYDAVLWDQTDSPDNPFRSSAGFEIVRINTRATDTISSMTRAQQGTSAIALTVGPSFAIAAVPTAKDWDDVRLLLQEQSSNFAVATGAANAYEITLDPVPTAYIQGAEYKFMPNASNTSKNFTLNVNGLGPKFVVDPTGASSIYENTFLGNRIYQVVYITAFDAFQLMSEIITQDDLSSNRYDSATAVFLSNDYELTFEKTKGTSQDILANSIVRFLAPSSNTGAVTITIGGNTDNLVKQSGKALTSNEIVANDVVEIMRRTANGDFQLMSSGVGPPSITDETSVSAAADDELLIADTSDGGSKKKVTVQSAAETARGLLLSFAEAYISVPVATVIGTTSDWVKMAGTTVLRRSELTDTGGAMMRIREIGAEPQVVKVDASITLTTASNNQVMHFAVVRVADLVTDPITTVAAASADIDISIPGHELELTDLLTIEGATGPIDGIPASEINAQHTITSIPDANTARVTVSTTATAGSVSGGGSAVISNTILFSSEQQRKTGTGADVGQVYLQGSAKLNQDESIEVWVRNETTATNMTAEHTNLTVEGHREI